MQFEPEESGEERRRRQRDYHAFLDAQVEARRHQQPASEDDATTHRLPVLPLSARSKHKPAAPYGAGSASNFAKDGEKASVLEDSGGLGDLDHRAETANRNGNEQYGRLEQRLEAEVQRRYLVERKLGVLGQKLENWITDSSTTINSLSARDAVVTEVQEITQQQVKALEEEARTRMQADEARSARFNQAVERVSGEVENLARRLEAEEKGTLQRVAKIEAAFTGEAKGARQATKQLGAQLQALDSEVSSSQNDMSSLLHSLRILEKRQKEQLSVAAEVKRSRDETEQLREQVRVLSAAVSGSEGKVTSLLQAVRELETRHQEQHPTGAARTEEQLSRQKMQLSGLMGDTAKRAVESTNVPQLMTTLRGRVELAEERLSNMADKSFRALEDELTGLRVEVTRLEGRIETGPIAAGLKALAIKTTAAQKTAQSQLTELQDALSAEITARRRNAVRLAEAQAATQEGGRESAVQAASGLRARCLELEELVARLTRDIQTAQEELSSQTQNQLAATQERNSRAVGKLEESLAGIRVQMAQQQAEEDRNFAKAAARVDELESLITGNKDLLREAEERARHAFAAVEAKRQEQAKQFADSVVGVQSAETVRIEALELALREQGNSLKEAIDAGHRTNRRRSDEIHAEVTSLESRLRTTIADAQENESVRVGSLLRQAQEQVNREVARVRQATDRVATETDMLREKMNSEEASRVESVQDLHRELSKSTEALQSRIRLWAEDRLRKESAATEESLKRAEAQVGMVRTLLDEAVKGVSKELEILRSESLARNAGLEDSLDERASELEMRLTEIDNGSAKKRRVTELTKETGHRIGEVERRVRQAEKELKEELEVKLAVSSLVCTVADNASTRRLEQGSSEVTRLEEKMRRAEAVEREGGLRAELAKTNAVVAGLQAEVSSSRGWQTGVDDLKLNLTSRIEELKAMVEAAESTAAIAKEKAAAALEAQANDANRSLKEGESANGNTQEDEAAATDGTGKAQGSQAKKAPKRVMDFAALNDELEAEDEEEEEDTKADDPLLSSRLSASSKDVAADKSTLKTRVSEIEGELAHLKQRLDEGVATMESLTQKLLGGGSAARVLPTPQRLPTISRRENGYEKEGARADEAPVSRGPDNVSKRNGKKKGTPPLSPTSRDSFTPPLSPKSDIMSDADTPPPNEQEADAPEAKMKGKDERSESEGGDATSVGSDTDSQETGALSETNTPEQRHKEAGASGGQSDGEGEESESEGSCSGSERDGSEAEEGRSRRPSSAEEVELVSRRDEEGSDTASDAGSASVSDESIISGSEHESSEEYERGGKEAASASGSERYRQARSREDSGSSSNHSGSEVSDGSETEGSVTPRSGQSKIAGWGGEDGEEGSSDDGSDSSVLSRSEVSPRRSSRESSSEETDK
eukprot:g5703.t2